MRFCFYVNIVSPHQLPLAREIAMRVGTDNFRYVHTEPFHDERVKLGWSGETPSWTIDANSDEAAAWLENADVVYSGLRDLDLFERRAAKGLATFYTSERWFKPLSLMASRILPRVRLSGRVRLLVPRFRRMAKRFVALSRDSAGFRVLPIGVHALRDFRMMGVPEEKMMLWGYFVEKSTMVK